MTVNKMNQNERNIALTLAGVFAMRMFGLFLVLPVLSLLASHYRDATPLLVGLAMGAYGLTQACLQIPMGMWSDKFGRKPIIYIGLLLFFSGSMLAASTDSFLIVIVGRALQGGGAIGAVIMALAADNIREQHRSKGMAIIGMSIGLSFIAAIVAGPVISNKFGLSGLFYCTAILSLVAIYLVRSIPENKHAQQEKSPWSKVLTNGQLQILNLSIFSLHFVLSAFFVFIPLKIQSLGFDLKDQTFIYLPVLFLSMVIMTPFMILTEKKHIHKLSMIGATGTLFIAVTSNLVSLDKSALFVLMAMFFSAFNLLEAMLPSMISRVAPAVSRGTAMGVYSTSQFAGVFFGGAAAGLAMQYFGQQGVIYVCAGVLLVWLTALLGFKGVSRNRQIEVDYISAEQIQHYRNQPLTIEVQKHGKKLTITYKQSTTPSPYNAPVE